MSDLQEVVEFSARLDEGAADGPVDGGIGADLYMIFYDHIADLR